MAIPGVAVSLRFMAQHLGAGSTHPVIMAASAVVVLALQVIDFAQDQEKALQLELNRLQKTLDAYKDVRELRGEARIEFLNSLTTIADTVDVAARLLPEAGQRQQAKVGEYDSALCDVLASVEMIHAEYDAARRFDQDLDSVVGLVNHVNNTMPHDEVQQLVRNLRENMAAFNGGTR